MDFILSNWQWILGGLVVLAIVGTILGKLEEKKLLREWRRLHEEKKRLSSEIDTIRDKRSNEKSEPERAKLWLEQRNVELAEKNNELEIAKLRIEITKAKLDEEKRENFTNERGRTDYCIKYADIDDAKERYETRVEWVANAEQRIQEQEEKNLFYQCKKCNEPYARERISNEWLNIEYLGSKCALEDEDGIERVVEDTESITKKDEQKGTARWHRIKMHKIYQCKHCNNKTDEIQNNKVSGDFFCCPQCAKDDVIKEVNKAELGTFKTYREVTETTSRGEKTKQVSITKVRERTDYECSNCGHTFSSINSRELR